MSVPETALTPEMHSLKERQREVWMAGDYGKIAETLADEAAGIIERLDLRPGEKVLDVACGTGNLAIPAARFGADVTGVDIASNLVEAARKRARAEGVDCRFKEGDAEALPFDDGSFETVVSMFGAMFAPRPEKVAEELIRVCRPGGRIVMINWTPDGFAGQMFGATSRHVPPPPNVPPPVLWGDEETVRRRLQDGIAELDLNRRPLKIRYPFSPAEVVEYFRQYFGPTQTAFASLDGDGQNALRRDLERVWEENNRADDGTVLIETEYLEVVAGRE